MAANRSGQILLKLLYGGYLTKVASRKMAILVQRDCISLSFWFTDPHL
jgi:hypothetical protein